MSHHTIGSGPNQIGSASSRLPIPVERYQSRTLTYAQMLLLRQNNPIEDDVNQVYPLTEDCWLAATGYFDLGLEQVGLQTGLGHVTGWDGLYRTTDAGETWRRVDPGNEYSYIRKVFTHDGTVFFSGAIGAPPAWKRVTTSQRSSDR